VNSRPSIGFQINSAKFVRREWETSGLKVDGTRLDSNKKPLPASKSG